eukprot:comp12935_c0_seq1/m.8146 comp12935_c0_seq1/g.8146  ORF comp12935_c0_seq1/g.8146 comp12935_c0_seq1/m.8146 type:complete len:424 (-) comp12935_c0_seq1:184-1455(-)
MLQRRITPCSRFSSFFGKYPAWSPTGYVSFFATVLLLFHTLMQRDKGSGLFLLTHKNELRSVHLTTPLEIDKARLLTVASKPGTKKILPFEIDNPLLHFYHDDSVTYPSPIAPFGWNPQLPLAFLLSAHDNDTLNGVAQNIRLLYHPSHFFVVHLDAKVSNESVNVFEAAFMHLTNVKIVETRLNVIWAKWSQVEMQKEQIKTALTLPGWVAALNLCGSSIPLKSLREIDLYLSNLILEQQKMAVSYDLAFPPCHQRAQPLHFHVCKRTPARCKNENCSQMTRTPGGKPIFKGSAWMVITREFADFSVNSAQAVSWSRFFAQTSMPDESYFQTLLANNPWFSNAMKISANMMEDHKITYETWWYECVSNKQERSGSPCYMGKNDWNDFRFQNAMLHPKLLIARKVHSDDEIREQIEKVINRNM